jgi:exosortase K
VAEPKVKRPQAVGLFATLALVVVGKQYFRTATADDLRWLLAPTARCVSVLTHTHFTHLAGAGYVDRDVSFVIAPVCAGLNFMLAAIIALAVAWYARMTTWRELGVRLVGIVAAAYAATIVVNTLRISLSIETHAGGELHRLEGIVVYLGGLCAVYAAARRGEPPAKRAIAIPFVAYLVITLVLPLCHGAASRPDFAAHAMWVLGGCAAIAIILAVLFRVANNRSTSGVSKRGLP